MKSEERHHLHENDLAGALDRTLKKVEPYSNQLLVGVLLAALVVVGAIIWNRMGGASSAAGWQDFAKAQTADDFLTVADDHPDTSVAFWAQLRAGEQFLNQGLRTATSDRKSTEDNLKNAESAFQTLLQNDDAPRQIRERALYGLAVCRETLSGADTQKAIEAYEELRNEFADSPYAAIAARRIADLKTEETREFYAWFDRQPRKPEERPKPKDLAGLSSETADPFLLGDSTSPTRPSHPDRPPSPSAPTRAADVAPPFPESSAPATPAPDSSTGPPSS